MDDVARVDTIMNVLMIELALSMIAHHANECAHNLAGRATLRRQILDHAKEHGVSGQFRSFQAFETSGAGHPAQ